MQQILYRIFFNFLSCKLFFSVYMYIQIWFPAGGGLLIKYSKSGHGNITVSECTSHVMQ